MTTSNLDKKFQEKTIEYFTDSSGYFNEESCDPVNWDYEPSTYGVEGVEICTSPHMVSFDDFNGGIENPGRDKIDYNAVEALQSCIKAKGIVTKGSRMLYYDIETGKRYKYFQNVSINVLIKLLYNYFLFHFLRFYEYYNILIK